jgi:hypothetical protein
MINRKIKKTPPRSGRHKQAEFDSIWWKLFPRLSARFKEPERFRAAYRRLFLLGFYPDPPPLDSEDLDLCNVVCGRMELGKPIPIQVSYEPMENGKLNPTFTYPNKDWIDAIRRVNTKYGKKNPSVFWVNAVGEGADREKEPTDGFRLAIWAKEFGKPLTGQSEEVFNYDPSKGILKKAAHNPRPQKTASSDRVLRKLGLLCLDALHNSDPAAFDKFEQFSQAVSLLRSKLTKDQAERVSRTRRFIECFEKLCLKHGVPPTKQKLREACKFKVPDPKPKKKRAMDEAQFRRDFLNAYGLYWLPTKYPWGDSRKA